MGSHKVHPASAMRVGGRASEIAAHIEAAGDGGIMPGVLASTLGVQCSNLHALLATVTPRYPAVAEGDDGRLYWVEWDDAGDRAWHT